MGIAKTSRTELKKHLIGLGLLKGDNVVVHCRLLSFGFIEGGPATVIDLLLDIIGSNGTLAVPAYTLYLTQSDVYDPLTTPSGAVGPLAEELRKTHQTYRTLCPLHNHVICGPLREHFCKLPGTDSLGEQSDFALMESLDFKLVLLGCSYAEGATFLHHLETVCQVPYREKIILQRQIRTDAGTHPIDVKYYALKSSGSTAETWGENFDVLKTYSPLVEIIKTQPCPYGTSYCGGLKEIKATITSLLSHSPYALVKATENG